MAWRISAAYHGGNRGAGCATAARPAGTAGPAEAGPHAATRPPPAPRAMHDHALRAMHDHAMRLDGAAADQRGAVLLGGAQMKAGKMKLIGTRLTPDKRKGTLRLFNSPEDTLLHLTWTSREVRLRPCCVGCSRAAPPLTLAPGPDARPGPRRQTGVMEDDRIIFPGDAEFKYVEQARNNPKNPRVYVLKFQGSTERLFFWMQVLQGARAGGVSACTPAC